MSKRKPQGNKPQNPRESGNSRYTRKTPNKNSSQFDPYYTKNMDGTMKRDYSKDTIGSCSKFNDWTWYAHSERNVADTASLAFNEVLGTPIDFSDGAGYAYTINSSTVASTAAPGIMSLYMIPIPGISTSVNSPLNVACDQINGFLRSKVSGERKYDSTQIGMYIMGMDSMFQFYNYMKRAYGILNYYRDKNRYVPRAILSSMGLNGTDLMNQGANFRFYINSFANRLSTWKVPSTMSILTRHSWLYSNVFKDSDSDQAQMYLYSPVGFYQYDTSPVTQTPPTPARLKFVPIEKFATQGGGNMDLGELIAYGNNLYNSFADSTEWDQVKSDILAAYGGQFFTMSEVEEGYVCEPTYVPEVSSQIENSTIWSTNTLYSTFHYDITEYVPDNIDEAPYLVCSPNIPNFGMINRDRFIVNTHNGKTSPADVMVMTRNMTIPKHPQTSSASPKLYTAGTEIIVTASIWTWNDIITESGEQQTKLNSTNFSSFEVVDTSDNASPIHMMRVIGKLSTFDWHPTVYLYAKTSSGENPAYVDAVVDLDDFVLVDRDTIARMHECAILSEFGVPMNL